MWRGAVAEPRTLAAALRSLNARLRVHGLTDEEAALLPTRIDKDTLGGMEIATWGTDAGDFDVLIDLPGRNGRCLRYDELIGRANIQDVHRIAVRVAALDDVIASKEGADRPKDREALVELRELEREEPAIRATLRPAGGIWEVGPSRGYWSLVTAGTARHGIRDGRGRVGRRGRRS